MFCSVCTFFTVVPRGLNCWGFIICFVSGKAVIFPSTLHLTFNYLSFPKISWWFLFFSRCFPDFSKVLLCFLNAVGIFIALALNAQFDFERLDILIGLSSIIQEPVLSLWLQCFEIISAKYPTHMEVTYCLFSRWRRSRFCGLCSLCSFGGFFFF